MERYRDPYTPPMIAVPRSPERKPEPTDEFYEEYPRAGRGSTVPRREYAYVYACLWVDGRHVEAGPKCPHGPTTPETDEITEVD